MDGGYSASALGHGIHTEGESLEEFRHNVKEAVGCSAVLACSFSLQTLRFAVHELAPRYTLQLSQCLTHAPDVVTVLGGELPPMRSHFFDDWIITHHLHPLVLPASTTPGKPDQNRTPR